MTLLHDIGQIVYQYVYLLYTCQNRGSIAFLNEKDALIFGLNYKTYCEKKIKKHFSPIIHMLILGYIFPAFDNQLVDTFTK